MNLGSEEAVKEEDHINIYFREELLARAEAKQVAPNRSIWQVFETKKPGSLQKENVYYFTLTDPVEFIPDFGNDAPSLTVEQRLPPEKRIQSPFYRFSFTFGTGTRTGTRYPYPGGISKNPRGQIYHLTWNWYQKFGHYSQFLWGLHLHYEYLNNKGETNISSQIRERRHSLGIGPMFGLDIWQNRVHRLFAFINGTYNPVHRVGIFQTNILGETQRAVFKGDIFSTSFGLSYERLDITNEFNFLFSTYLKTVFPTTLETDDRVADLNFWPSARISNRRYSDIVFSVGIQYPY